MSIINFPFQANFDPNLITPSEYVEILAKVPRLLIYRSALYQFHHLQVDPHPTTYPGYISLVDQGMPYIKPGGKLVIAEDVFQVCRTTIFVKIMSWLGIKMQCDQVNEVIGEGGFARCFSAAWETGPPAGDEFGILQVYLVIA